MKNTDVGLLIMRVALAVVMLPHGIAKITSGVGFISGLLASHGLPTFLAYGVYLGEIVGPLMLLVGYYSRYGAALVAGNMVVAIALAHTNEIFALNAMGAWAIELQALMLFTAVGLFFTGPGKYSWKN